MQANHGIIFSLCECEHVSHFDKREKSPNGNPNHPFGQKFNIALMRDVETPYGVFKVCPHCSQDCCHPDNFCK